MTLQTLFDKFSIFADAPEAVAKIRELVIELAMQGKLSERRTSDQDDDRWRSFIQSGDKYQDLQDFDTPTAFKIPDEWKWVGLNEIATPCGHKKPDGPFTYIDVGSIDNLQGKIKDSVEIREAFTAPSRARKLVKLGTVIFSTVRPYLKNIAVVDRTFEPSAIASTAFATLDPIPFVDSRFLFYWLRSSSFEAEVSKRMKGVAYPAISDSNFRACPMPLPPPAEQKRIVTKVDELMALCDRLEAWQQERAARHQELARAALARFTGTPTTTNLDILFHKAYDIAPAALRETILNLAVRGKLVPQNSNEESAKECLSRLNLKPTCDETKNLPHSWCWVSFEDVAITSSGVTLGRDLGDRKTVSLPYLRVANVKRGDIDLGIVKEISIAEDELGRYALRENDLLMTEGGDWDKVGRAAIWRGQIRVCLHQNHVFRSRMRSDEISPVWFEHYFNSPEGRRYFESASKQTTNLASINMRQVRACPVPFPPLAEQRRIVEKVDALMQLVSKLETQIAEAHNNASSLLEAAVADLTGVERKSQSNFEIYMKLNAAKSWKPRAHVEPLTLSTRSFVLRRFKMESQYRSLSAFDCCYHLENAGPNEASPICLVGLNGSGKSNLIEAIAEVFCFLELINLPWKKVESTSSRYRENRHQFELEYVIQDGKDKHLVRIRKTKKSGAEFFTVKADGTEESVAPGRDQLLLLPRKIIGYSSGLNETVSHPFLRTKTIYSEEVRDAAPPEGIMASENDTVFDTRTLYMDYESNAAILISNFLFRKPSDLAIVEKFTRVRGVSSFGLHFNRKRAGKSGLHSTVRLTGELHSYLKKFAYCAGESYDETQSTYDFKFKLTGEVRKRFRQEFGTAENLFMAMHKWSLLNALILSDEQRKVYLRSDITKGALERPPSVPPSDRIFDIVDLKLNLSIPRIEIDYSGLSDGEHQFIQVFGTAMLFSEPGTLFLLDEPESHFNPEWRTKFNLILNALPNASRQEYVISTHSPYIVSGSRKSNVYKFERDGATIKFASIDFETYGASFDVLLKKLFSIESLIDQSAKAQLQKIIKRGKVEEMKTAIGEFAESKEKRKLYEAIITKEEKK